MEEDEEMCAICTCSTHGEVRMQHFSRKTSNEEPTWFLEKYFVKLSMLKAKWSETSPICICFRKKEWNLSRVYLFMTCTL